MIVEDDPMVAEFNRRYLERIEGFELVTVVHRVKDAVDVIKNYQLDLILLDIYMPGETGLDLLTKILKLGKGLDVIIISAASDVQSVKKALRYGAIDYLIKPFEFDRFQEALISYREEVRFSKKKDVLSQADLDKHLLYKESNSFYPAELPKGLSKSTLKRIYEEISQRTNVPFSSEELAAIVGISRVSMQKYIYFLTDINVLISESYYGAVGRPVTKYQFNPSKSSNIQTYL